MKIAVYSCREDEIALFEKYGKDISVGKYPAAEPQDA